MDKSPPFAGGAPTVNWGPPWQAARPVTADFFEQPTEALAYALLGQWLVHDASEGLTAGRIVEVEMYRGPHDKGAHSYGGRRTARTAVMFGPPGHAYVYRIYGLHCCLNVVAAPPGAPEAILIRALEPGVNLDLMRRRRGMGEEVPACRLTDGPGKLTQALGISMAAYGQPLWQPPLYLAAGPALPAETVDRGPRINIAYAEEARWYPWRFWIRGHPCVSRPGGRRAGGWREGALGTQ